MCWHLSTFMNFQALTSQKDISFIPFPLINKTKLIFSILLRVDKRMEFSLYILHSSFSLSLSLSPPFPLTFLSLSLPTTVPFPLPSNSQLILFSPSPSPSSLFFSFILLCLHPPHSPLFLSHKIKGGKFMLIFGENTEESNRGLIMLPFMFLLHLSG